MVCKARELWMEYEPQWDAHTNSGPLILTTYHQPQRSPRAATLSAPCWYKWGGKHSLTAPSSGKSREEFSLAPHWLLEATNNFCISWSATTLYFLSLHDLSPCVLQLHIAFCFSSLFFFYFSFIEDRFTYNTFWFWLSLHFPSRSSPLSHPPKCIWGLLSH